MLDNKDIVNDFYGAFENSITNENGFRDLDSNSIANDKEIFKSLKAIEDTVIDSYKYHPKNSNIENNSDLIMYNVELSAGDELKGLFYGITILSGRIIASK